MCKKLNIIWPSFTFLLPANVSYFSSLVDRSVSQSVGKLIGCHYSLLHAVIIGVSTSNKFIMYLQFNYL